MAVSREPQHGPTELLLEHSRVILEIEYRLKSAKVLRRRTLAVRLAAPILAASLLLINVAGSGLVPLARINSTLIPLGIIAVIVVIIDPLRAPSRRWDARYISEQRLELELAQERKRLQAVHLHLDASTRRHMYKESVPAVIERYQDSGKRYRAVHNSFQSVIIVGSLATSILAGMGDSGQIHRWLTVGFSFLVGLSAGFTGYFKYRERSFYLQQTADAIEEELNGINLKTGRYRTIATDDEAIAEFTERVEVLQNEQRKRQQQLDQPAQASVGE